MLGDRGYVTFLCLVALCRVPSCTPSNNAAPYCPQCAKVSSGGLAHRSTSLQRQRSPAGALLEVCAQTPETSLLHYLT